MITSNSNDRIVAIRKLLESKHRRATNRFLAEGLRVVAQALESHAAVDEIVYAPDLLISEFGQDLVARAEFAGIPVIDVSPSVFFTLAQKDKPQGIAAVIQQKWLNLPETKAQPGDLWVALQAVQNPGNLGTVLRTCDAVGANGLLLLDDCTDPYDPAAVKASMGSIFTVPLAHGRLQDLRDWLAANPVLKVVGSSDRAEMDCFKAAYPETCLVLMGSEREGLPDGYFALCDDVVRIPMEGACDSLNLSVATAVILYQIYAHRRMG